MKRLILTAIIALSLSACSESNAEVKQTHVASEKSHYMQNFTEEAFDQLQLADKSILIDVHATWCGTCKMQSTVIKEYFASHPNSEINVLKVDYDTQTQWVKYFKAPRQSTLVLYKGEQELDRVIAQTNQDKLFSFLEQGE